ncbi:uncharacterized protein LOC103171433 [Ornithorhynchus anatinus]|uniref:uncharacterized protein LOC103171433 n=1 Tax=Ornithorhynchus anatinus TaxID=9258 RepID=UPI0010A7B730|nr:uncharacterized protein LOC103171433 [Ornithorhynchus anatinus]
MRSGKEFLLSLLKTVVWSVLKPQLIYVSEPRPAYFWSTSSSRHPDRFDICADRGAATLGWISPVGKHLEEQRAKRESAFVDPEGENQAKVPRTKKENTQRNRDVRRRTSKCPLHPRRQEGRRSTRGGGGDLKVLTTLAPTGPNQPRRAQRQRYLLEGCSPGSCPDAEEEGAMGDRAALWRPGHPERRWPHFRTSKFALHPRHQAVRRSTRGGRRRRW